MAERALKCPQCNGPLAPSRFARSVVCNYCGATVQIDAAAVSAATFRDAFQAWNAPAAHGYSTWATVADGHWAVGPLVAHGEISDVYFGQRARWPTELVLVKVLRDAGDAPLLAHEWDVLTQLQDSAAPDAPALAARLPQPVAHGAISDGAFGGSRALVLRWSTGFLHTFEAARAAYPQGIEPRISIWMWRRALEILSFLHAAGFVHGAVLPPHLLLQDNEHGVRLVGYSCADRPGTRLRAVNTRFEAFYPPSLLGSQGLTAAADVAMSARCVATLLGGDPATGEVPAAVPAPLARLVQAAAIDPSPADSAWTLRERLGQVAQEAYGPPTFCPLAMPR